MSNVLIWAIFQAAVCYGRKNYSYSNIQGTGKYEAFRKHYNLLWELQRDMQYPPTGLIRSC